MKRLLIIIVVMFSMLPLLVQKTQAYWAEDVLSNQSINTSNVVIGEWQLFPTWEPNPIEPYQVGDVVFWEGKYYVRIIQAGQSNIQPGSAATWVFWEFWE